MLERMKRGKKVIIPGDGTSLWVLTWNGDFARGLIGLLGNPDALGQAFQITSDEVLTWEQIYLEAYRALGVAPNVVHIPSDLIANYWPHAYGSLIGDKSNSVVFDNSKIKKFIPDFTCDVSWAEGLRRALAWFEANPEYQTVDQELDSIFDNLIRSYERVFLT